MTSLRITCVILTLLSAQACGDSPTPPPLHPTDEHQLILQPLAGSGQDLIRDRYIVWLHPFVDNAAAIAAAAADEPGVRVHFVYERTIKGFAATLPAHAAAAWERHPFVVAVAPDRLLQAWSLPWGVDRTDQRELPLNGSFAPFSTGDGIDIYIMDGGVMSSHDDFGGRAVTGHPDAYDAFRDPSDPDYAEDCWGQEGGVEGNAVNAHGTHVAGTAGGSNYGVAKAATLISVRVMRCSGSEGTVSTPEGTISSVLAGVEWVTANADGVGVVNMSLGGRYYAGSSEVLEAAITESIGTGLTYVVAAGNDNQDACNYSPGRMAGTITVAASTSDDARWAHSNYGSCVDIFAPGEDILSASPVEAGVMNLSGDSVASGTSMASPHVAGIAALYLQSNPSASPAEVRTHLLGSSTSDELSAIGALSPNRLAFTVRLLSSEIDGPTVLYEGGYNTWYAVVDGGDPGYGYSWWKRSYGGGIPGGWDPVGGDEPTLTLPVAMPQADFDLRLRVSSGEQTDTSYLYIRGNCNQPGQICPMRAGGLGGLGVLR